MKFRLNKHDDEIAVEAFLKAVKANEDYQQIRFMIKDGKVWVNGEKEYARRRMLKPGDNVAFEDKYFLIYPHRDENVRTDRKRDERPEKDFQDNPVRAEKIHHHKIPMNWTEKNIVRKKKSVTKGIRKKNDEE